MEAEAAAIRAAGVAIDPSFERAARMILGCTGSVLTSGVGKAGHVARKLSATLASTGTPSHFLSATDAVHGDLGSIRRGDAGALASDRAPVAGARDVGVLSGGAHHDLAILSASSGV